ncbi:Gfo/Idh/MocA family oxidoreductase [Algibacter amylolyticus]|uniref:Gfo/Idh/MocA family oxidoreductase n=1 Tax=Algibacter amylolyticus TaxID=1608400 RepID=A0A5M7B2R6_9FLAO|nr:Gfo/Idh/MocA family oxidoreductase [Algibacter amylolyticus]KAA5823732.1 Gfo/Idh/MocA family oxidoreductase [Algibacter amylolyticus]MBB5267903.1 putative dehydrogenase [Algibacter amylolyticus]TSJ74220.1 Gfo/Idh/MocA family oxidoreductase [Algibacter amylolyticus]
MESSRRKFIKQTAMGTMGTLIVPQLSFGKNIFNANETINVAVIGVRSRAKSLTQAIHKYEYAKIIYTCDVDDDVIDEHNIFLQKNIGYVPKVEKDFRKILDDKDVDAVFIATPEHWHAPMAIMALQAGKHVYVEKPCSHNPHENELLVAAQRKYKKIVQMGNQQRSAQSSALAVKEIKEGVIGNVYKGEAYYSANRGSIGTGKLVDVPKTLNWDLWQGPAPREAFRDNVHPYNWHWFKSWGTGEIHNNGTHEIDICRWALGVDLPNKVTSFGGKYTFDDDWQFPDNQEVTYQYDDKLITWTGHSRGKIQPSQPGRGASIYGSKGVITLSRNNYKLFGLDGELIKTVDEKVKSETTNTVGGGGLDVTHIANFFNAIRLGEKLNAPIEDASISTMMCHLGNIAQDVGETINIDPKTGKIEGNKRAMKNWKRDYEKGWEPKL